MRRKEGSDSVLSNNPPSSSSSSLFVLGCRGEEGLHGAGEERFLLATSSGTTTANLIRAAATRCTVDVGVDEVSTNITKDT